MALFVNTNVGSLNAQYNLTQSQNSLQTALQRLSSGLRVNSAQDDSAGYAIANRMQSQVVSVNQAVRNANDGISLAQTANSGLNNISTNLQTLARPAAQIPANASNSSLDRASIQTQVNQILADIQSVASGTQFNGVNLLDGSFSAQTFQVGANQGQTIAVSNLGNATTAALGSGTEASVSAVGNSNALSSADLVLNGVAIAGSSSIDDGFSYTSNASSAIAKAATINKFESQTGVHATVSSKSPTAAAPTWLSQRTPRPQPSPSTASRSTPLTAAPTPRRKTAPSPSVQVNNYFGQTGVMAIDTGSDSTGVKRRCADGRNITIGTTITATVSGLAAAATYFGGFTLTAASAISVQKGSGTLSQSGLTAEAYAAQQAAAVTANSVTNANLTSIAAGDITINGVVVGGSSAYDLVSTTSNATSALAKAAAINAVKTQSGVPNGKYHNYLRRCSDGCDSEYVVLDHHHQQRVDRRLPGFHQRHGAKSCGGGSGDQCRSRSNRCSGNRYGYRRGRHHAGSRRWPKHRRNQQLQCGKRHWHHDRHLQGWRQSYLDGVPLPSPRAAPTRTVYTPRVMPAPTAKAVPARRCPLWI